MAEPEPEVGEQPPSLLDLCDENFRQVAGSLDNPDFCRLFASCRQSREVLLPDRTTRKEFYPVLHKYGIESNATKVDLGWDLKDPLDVVVPALQSLTNLTELGLHYNQIVDVAPLQSLTNLTTLDLDKNQISRDHPSILALRKRGVRVYM